MPASAWLKKDIVLPEESLTEVKRSHHAAQNYRQTIVSNQTYIEPKSKLHRVVHLQAYKQEDPTHFNSTATINNNDHLVEENEQEIKAQEEKPLKLH